MNILISPNAFKGTMSALEAGEIIQDFLLKNFPQVKSKLLPIADGGDGTCELLTQILDLKKRSVMALDPFGRPAEGFYGWDEHTKTAYVDVSTASGIALIGKEPLNPYVASTYGTGQVIRAAIDDGAEQIILGLGGSATVDLGIGILAALGVYFLDQNGRELVPFSPNYLSKIRHIQKSPRIPKIKILCLCDVKNKFFGEKGAIPVFGPQKGIISTEMESYESVCKSAVSQIFHKQKRTFKDKPGFGAAGGIGLGLSAFFETDIKHGAQYFFEKVNLSEQMGWADLIITGEGRYDNQSKEGKACYELMQLAQNQNKKIALITSGNENGIEEFDQVLRLPDLDYNQSNFMDRAKENLRALLTNKLSLDF